jgi:hypothetical protein
VTTEAQIAISELYALAANLRDSICARAGNDKSRAVWTTSVQIALDFYRKNQPWLLSELLPPITADVLPEKWKKDSFLLDFVVWRRDLNGHEGAWLACESEWDLGSKAIIKDFEKLLSFKAPLKLMIYDIKNRDPAASREAIKASIARFRWHSVEETYLFLEFVNNEKAANAYSWKFAGEPLTSQDVEFVDLF